MTRLFILLLLTGCASQHTQQVVLNPYPNVCQVIEVRSTMLSTSTGIVCWGRDGEVISAEWMRGEAAVTVPIAILEAITPIGAAALLGSKLVEAAMSIPKKIDILGKVSGKVGIDVDVAGQIDGPVHIIVDE